jgi:hypothetical protein
MVSPSLRLNSITVRSGEVIHSLAFSYSGDHGKQHHAGPWGASEGFSYGSFDTVCKCNSSYIYFMEGGMHVPSDSGYNNIWTEIIFFLPL